EWSQTEAARQAQERLEQLRALDRAVDEAVRWYEQLVDDGFKLWEFERRQPDAAGPSGDWQAGESAGEEVFGPAARPPLRGPGPGPRPGLPHRCGGGAGLRRGAQGTGQVGTTEA